MRSARFGLLVCLSLFSISVWGQQTQPGTAPPPAPKDPQAVSVVNQALSAAGGAVAITGIADFTETGSVTYYSGPNPALQGTVTIRGRGFDEFRIDTSLPSGTRSECINRSITMKYEDGSTRALHVQSPLYPAKFALPVLQLRAALTSPGLSLLYKGTAEVAGGLAYDVQVRRVLPESTDPNSLLMRYLTVDYFIDSSTYRVLMLQDTVPKGLPRQVEYSDFKVASGIVAPFSITETIQGQTLRVINLNLISFNSGLLDSDFEL